MSGSAQRRRWYGWRAATMAVTAAVTAVTLGACGGPANPAADPSTPGPAPSSAGSTGPQPPPPSKPVSSPSTQEPVKDQVRIPITIKNGKVDPSGKKIDVPLGATVVLNVVSDEDDEIHAHIGGGDGFSLEVQKGIRAQGQFTLNESGSFEVESHHLEKIIVILNVR